jgi:hypothetical protein
MATGCSAAAVRHTATARVAVVLRTVSSTKPSLGFTQCSAQCRTVGRCTYAADLVERGAGTVASSQSGGLEGPHRTE